MNLGKLWLSVLMGLAAIVFVVTLARAQPKPITACGTTISTPGSYVVTQNLTANSTSVPCIKVTASGVTIDLGGFVLTGLGGSQGISASGGPLSVSNGFIRSFSGGISAPVVGVSLRNVTVLETNGGGASLGDNAEVAESEFLGNGADGLDAGNSALIIDSTFVGNTVNGLASGSGAVVTESVAANNNSANHFDSGGLNTAGRATVTGNAAGGNGFAGFFEGVGGSTFEGNTGTSTTGDGLGFYTNGAGEFSNNDVFIGNSAVGNVASGHGVGIVNAGGSTFVANTADGNGFYGISAGPGTYVTNTVDSNNSFGFIVTCPSNLVGNTAEDNTTAFSSGNSGCNVQINLGF